MTKFSKLLPRATEWRAVELETPMGSSVQAELSRLAFVERGSSK